MDFRELVKDLAALFRTRIELRQIGVRDEAKLVGGVGPCGRTACCAQYLGEFEPVSIKMAKEQSLSLNPTKISGLCGRLMCCLKYEHENYEELISKIPQVGSIVITPTGRGTVVNSYTLLERVKVRIKLKDGTEDILQFQVDEIETTGEIDPEYQRTIENSDEEHGINELFEME